jgi:hypothetical protein
MFIDRCQALWARKFLLKTVSADDNKRGVFIATAGQTYPDVFEHTTPVAGFLFNVAGVKNKNMQYILLDGLDKKTDFLKSDKAKEKVLQAALDLAEKEE